MYSEEHDSYRFYISSGRNAAELDLDAGLVEAAVAERVEPDVAFEGWHIVVSFTCNGRDFPAGGEAAKFYSLPAMVSEAVRPRGGATSRELAELQTVLESCLGVVRSRRIAIGDLIPFKRPEVA